MAMRGGSQYWEEGVGENSCKHGGGRAPWAEEARQCRRALGSEALSAGGVGAYGQRPVQKAQAIAILEGRCAISQ